jgi:serine protease inhibitor
MSYVFSINMFNNLDGASNIISPLLLSYILGVYQLGSDDKSSNQISIITNNSASKNLLKNYRNILLSNMFRSQVMIIINTDISFVNPNYLNMIRKLSNVYYISKKSLNDNIRYKISRQILVNTSGLMRNIVPDTLSKYGSIDIISTLMIDCVWEYQFEKKTITDLFHKSSKIELMCQLSYHQYYESANIKLLEMNLKDIDYRFGIILPKKYLEEDNLDYNLAGIPIMTHQQLLEMINNLEYTLVDVKIPIFSHYRKYNLSETIIKMGLVTPFTKNHTEMISPHAQLNDVITATYINIDITGDKIPQKYLSSDSKYFCANHEFIYYVRHYPTNKFIVIGDFQGNNYPNNLS